ncbi:MAG: hypothetical protein FP827_00775, partial [Candidatus Omnitrophica bacterium]|nr:hypothetical protein [Candidatus Omnitrophota bacterium]
MNKRKLQFAFLPLAAFFMLCLLKPANAETTACSYMYYNRSPVSMGMGGLDDVFENFPSVS